jgi:hypothetical protein
MGEGSNKPICPQEIIVLIGGKRDKTIVIGYRRALPGESRVNSLG